MNEIIINTITVIGALLCIALIAFAPFIIAHLSVWDVERKAKREDKRRKRLIDIENKKEGEDATKRPRIS